MTDAYLQYRRWNKDMSSTRSIDSTGATANLATGAASGTLYVQRIHVHVATAASGVTWTVKDNASTPLVMGGPYPTDTANTHTDTDYGPRGMPITEGKNLSLAISATGAVGNVSWEGYLRLSSTQTP